MTLELTNDEPLVLFEFLSRLEETEGLQWEDSAEEMVLWRLQAQLERSLVQPFQENYQELLIQARDRVRQQS